MADQPAKRQRVFLCVAKKSQYGWIGRIGGADISISFGKKSPQDLVITLLERPMDPAQQRPAPPRPQPHQRPPPQPHQRPPPQARPAYKDHTAYAPQGYESDDPGPGEDDLPF